MDDVAAQFDMDVKPAMLEPQVKQDATSQPRTAP
jgi:hypothetical protein